MVQPKYNEDDYEPPSDVIISLSNARFVLVQRRGKQSALFMIV